MVKDARGEVYTGFANFSELAGSQCDFVPMNSNRAINMQVVHQRVAENIASWECYGRYLDFGQINLMVIADDQSHIFLVMDGQHRCETMRSLNRQFPARELAFQFRAKVVDNEEKAFEELDHFQRSYPTDPRSFFHSRAESRAATAVVERLKAVHRRAFKDMKITDRHGRGTVDPPRPYLNDNLLFWLLKDAGIAHSAALEEAAGAAEPPAAGAARPVNAAAALALLDQASALLAVLPKEELGAGATEEMRRKAADMGCWLGFFREGKLGWAAVAHRLEAQQQVAPAGGAVGSNGAAAADGAAAAGVPLRAVPTRECAVCLESEDVALQALVPCGHECVCADCAAALLAAPEKKCPVCRADITSSMRVWRS